MTSKSLLQPPFRTLRAIAIGLSIACAAPAFADNLPEIQRLMKAGQNAQALEKVDSYLSTRPKDAQGRFLKGIILTEMNRAADAVAVFTKLSEDYPELPEPYNNLAVLYAQQRQYDKARTALEMAIRTHPSYAIAYENLGDIYAKLASQAYDKALQLDSANAVTQSKLALIRDLISTSTPGKNTGKPAVASPTAAPPVAAAPASAPIARPATTTAVAQPAAKLPPSATVIAATPGAAASTPGTPVATVQPAASAPTPVVAAARPAPAPAPAPTTSAPARDEASAEIEKVIAAWASAWSRKDMRAYLATYASDFSTPRGVTRKAWEKERQQRIGERSGKISVTYDEPRITIEGDRATARFRQHYKAAGLDSSSNKTLVFVRVGSKWLIKEENAR